MSIGEIHAVRKAQIHGFWSSKIVECLVKACCELTFQLILVFFREGKIDIYFGGIPKYLISVCNDYLHIPDLKGCVNTDTKLPCKPVGSSSFRFGFKRSDHPNDFHDVRALPGDPLAESPISFGQQRGRSVHSDDHHINFDKSWEKKRTWPTSRKLFIRVAFKLQLLIDILLPFVIVAAAIKAAAAIADTAATETRGESQRWD